MTTRSIVCLVWLAGCSTLGSGGCAPAVTPTSTAVDRVDVDDFADASASGHTALVWVQGNSAFVEGAVACWESICAVTEADGFAALSGLPDGEVAIDVQTGQGVPLVIPLTLNNHWAPHLAARSLTPDIYASWMGPDAWPEGTGLIDVWLDDATDGGGRLMSGVRLEASAGDVWSVHDLTTAERSPISSGTGPLWVANAPEGTVELTLTIEGALCRARSVGWQVSTEDTAEGHTLHMTVPSVANHATSIYVQCVDAP